VKGKILNTEIDQPHDFDKSDWDKATNVPHIHFEGELVIADQNVLIPILQGYVDHVSIGADADAICSECGKSTRPLKSCDCVSHDVLKNIRVKEYSIITEPAYNNATFIPFTAAVNKYLEKDENTEDISDSETIPEQDVIPPEIDETPFVAAVEEIVVNDTKTNANQDTQEVPDIKQNKEANMPQDKEEMQAGEEQKPDYTAEDIGGLTSAVKELVALLSQMKEEAAAEEDDEKKVQANDGNVTEDHRPESGNPMKDTGHPETMPALPATTVEIPKRTPSMSASKGVSAGLVGSTVKTMTTEQAAFDEVMRFAASRFIVPRK